MNEEYLILVDEKDQQWGKIEKLKAHELGLLHRAFSIFLFNNQGELLLQQRAKDKYHSPGLWTNTCCSHPHFGEETKSAVYRRLQEEMCMACELSFVFKFKYKTHFPNGLIEHEFDHVYFGYSDHPPLINPREVQDYKYMSLNSLVLDIQKNPSHYTEWLKICLLQVVDFNEKQREN